VVAASFDGALAIWDVRSGAAGVALDGTPYNEL